MRQRSDLLERLADPGGGLRVHGAHRLGRGMPLQGLLDRRRLDGLAPSLPDADDLCPAPASDLGHPFGERPTHHHHGHVPRFEDIGQGRLHRGRSGSGDRVGQLVRGLEHLAQHGLDLVQHLEAGRVEVADHRMGHGLEHTRVDVAGSGPHEDPRRRLEWSGDLGHRPPPADAGAGATSEGPISRMDPTPERAMASFSSSRMDSSIRRTPFSPPTASAQRYGRPTSTALAPRARALRTSLPRRTPPSISTSILPLTASTTSGRASSVPGAPSSCRPPWLETMMPSTPASTARPASSAVTTPFSTSGKGDSDRSHGRSSQQNEESWSAPKYAARLEPSASGSGIPSRLARPMPSGRSNRFRSSRRRRPSTGVSTVKTMAWYPVAWALLTRFVVMS